MIAKQYSKPKSTRKSRTKHRRPKYLSLRLQLIPTIPPPPMSTTNHHDHKQQLINLFPLHPENLVEQDKLDDEHNMACMFSSCDDVDGAATTLTGILCSDEDDDDNGHDTDNIPSPSSVNYAEEEGELVRTAMRRTKTERIDDHEKWVCYSEVVDRKTTVIREISSSSSTTTASCHHRNSIISNNRSSSNNNKHFGSKLALKLDYEHIMKSWVNKGPLYISDVDAPQPQTVPDFYDDHEFSLPSSINVATHDEQDNGRNGGLWTVPQMAPIENNGINIGDDALQAGESSPVAHNREASVKRYKEKRRNRLFAKTVRYEVRKLNAEKRPRIKGRFVKSN